MNHVFPYSVTNSDESMQFFRDNVHILQKEKDRINVWDDNKMTPLFKVGMISLQIIAIKETVF